MTAEIRPNSEQPTLGGVTERPTIAIYQNADHVAGILQQLERDALPTGHTWEQGSDRTAGDKSGTSRQTGFEAGIGTPSGPRLAANRSKSASSSDESTDSLNTRSVRNFTYSQAYYLFAVRQQLSHRGLIQVVTCEADAKNLGTGDFVEFQASFRPNALHALLDILTPELVAAIAEYRVKSKAQEEFDVLSATQEERQAFYELVYSKARTDADLAAAVTRATRADFRAEKTREFYGIIRDVTAITILDNSHFVVEDEDRILDGTFTVLGKITSTLERDVPVLGRNKLLDRLNPELVDQWFQYLVEAAEKSVSVPPPQNDFDNDLPPASFDLTFPSRIKGPSFRVIPIAVYV